MKGERNQKLIRRAERGEISVEEYQSLVDDLGLSEEEEAFMKMTGTGLIMENRGKEALELSEQLLEEKYTTDELIDEAINEIEGLSEIYERHMGKAISSLEYSAEVFEQVKENIEEADSAQIYIDIDIEETGESRRSFLEKLFWGGVLATGAGIAYESSTGSSEQIDIVEENIGGAPGVYDTEVLDGSEVERYLEQMSTQEQFSKFKRVEEMIGSRDVDMGLIYEDNRIDFYDGEIVSSVEMSDGLYQEAIDEI